MSDHRLSDDQQQARFAVLETIARRDLVTVLVGPAGSGKTTLMETIINDLEGAGRTVDLMAPTGKAASVLSAKTGRDAATVHSALYQRVNEDGEDLVFTKPKPPCSTGGVVVCDEASMVGLSLYDEMVSQVRRRTGAQMLFVGDREQLPPVGEPWGPDFDVPTAALTQVHRQALGSPILGLATAIRQRTAWSGWREGVCDRSREDPIPWLVSRIRGGVDATLLCYTNKTRAALNLDARLQLGHRSVVEVGDRLVCTLNNVPLDMMNGEVAVVVDVTPDEAMSRDVGGRALSVTLDNGVRATINADLIGAPVRDFKAWRSAAKQMKRPTAGLLSVDYGFALTVHKSQGSQWDSVGFVADSGYQWLKRKKPDEARRLAYTAVTRAARSLRIFQ